MQQNIPKAQLQQDDFSEHVLKSVLANAVNGNITLKLNQRKTLLINVLRLSGNIHIREQMLLKVIHGHFVQINHLDVLVTCFKDVFDGFIKPRSFVVWKHSLKPEQYEELPEEIKLFIFDQVSLQINEKEIITYW